MHTFDKDVRDKPRIRIGRCLRRIRFVELNLVGTIVQLAGIGSNDWNRSAQVIVGTERSQRTRTRNRIKTYHQEVISRVHNDVRGEVETDRIAQPPRIRWEALMEQRNVVVSNVMELDKFIELIVVRPDVRRMVHDFANHNRPDLRIRIGEPGAAAELNYVVRTIRAEREAAHRN